MKSLKKNLLAIAFAMVALPASVFAHATSIGYGNAGPGSVTVWLGTYNHGGHHLEGSMNLVGVNGTIFASSTIPFTLTAGFGYSTTPDFAGKPPTLIDGTTNFFADNAGPSTPLLGTDPMLFGGVDHWQGATFTGLTPGDYQFTWVPSANASAEWSVLNTNMNGVFTLSGQVVTGNVPDAGATLALFGMAIGGLRFGRRFCK